ncbi:unnamed protein product [Cochlearia groenlandica]
MDSNKRPHVLSDSTQVNKSSFKRKKIDKLDDVRSNGWLDAMISSSPPGKRVAKDLNLEIAPEDDFSQWMLKYPSAISSFGDIVAQAKNKKIAVFLDYDGTLSPIVDDPDRTNMSNAMRAAVKDVAKYFPTAVVSGRSRDTVSQLVGLTELYYAGSHGMDISTPINLHRSDEDTNLLREGNRGFGILVSPVPKESDAFYSLKDTSEVKKFLKTLAKWRKLEENSTCS